MDSNNEPRAKLFPAPKLSAEEWRAIRAGKVTEVDVRRAKFLAKYRGTSLYEAHRSVTYDE